MAEDTKALGVPAPLLFEVLPPVFPITPAPAAVETHFPIALYQSADPVVHDLAPAAVAAPFDALAFYVQHREIIWAVGIVIAGGFFLGRRR